MSPKGSLKKGLSTLNGCSTPVWRVLPGHCDRNLWWELSRKGVRAAGTFLHQGCDITKYTAVTQVSGRPFQMVVCAEKDTGHGVAGADGR